MERLVHKGRVSELTANGKPYLALDMPRKPEEATMSFALETVLSIQEIFKPYLGKDIIITVEKEDGKVRRIAIVEESDK
jgi:hypothetical protein